MNRQRRKFEVKNLVNNEKFHSWTVGFKQNGNFPSMKSTSKLKPYVRKSLSDVKPTLANKGKSVPADGQGLASTKFQSRSSWMIPKEASEKYVIYIFATIAVVLSTIAVIINAMLY